MPTRWNFLYVNKKKKRKNRYLIFIIYMQKNQRNTICIFIDV